MKLLIKSFPLLSIGVLILAIQTSCQAKKVEQTKTVVVTEESKKEEPKDDSMISWAEKGYFKAVVTYDESAKEQCQYTLTTPRGERLESLEFPAEMKVADLAVWLKYAPQRRMSQCPGAQPIAILDLVERK